MIPQGWKSSATRFICCLLACFSAPLVFSQVEPQAIQPVTPATPATPATVTGIAQAPDSPNAGQSDQSSTVESDEIQIGAGDLVEIRVFGVQDLTEETRVSGSGDISVPLVGSVHVAGLTQVQAESLIARKLREGGFLNDPHVSVFTKEYATQGVSVLGEVSRPGVYALLGPRRLFDVISMAGGLTPRAGRLITITHRDDLGKPLNLELAKDPSQSADNNPPVAPGDTLYVSKAGIVYVVGDVAHPAGFVMDNNEHLTVLQAIALAGGANGTASLNSSKIIRKTPSGVQEIPMPLKKILSAQADDVALQPEDVLFIPKSGAKSVTRRSAEAVLQVATGLAIYGRR